MYKEIFENQLIYTIDAVPQLVEWVNEVCTERKKAGVFVAEISRFFPFEPDGQYACVLHLLKLGVLYCDPCTDSLYATINMHEHFSIPQLDRYLDNRIGTAWSKRDEEIYAEWLTQFSTIKTD